LWSVAGAGSRRRWPTPKPGSGGNGASKVRPRSGQPIPGPAHPRWPLGQHQPEPAPLFVRPELVVRVRHRDWEAGRLRCATYRPLC
jgi:hypothetical protein